MAGSPPHGRGTRSQVRRAGPPVGLTPAWAGNTGDSSERPAPPRAHPRMGGEHLARCNRDHGVPGLTPAWAGNTGWAASGSGRRRAHPRMGGEHVGGGRAVGDRRWLTPAWAGNTAWNRTRQERTEAHPRMGGEHSAVSGVGPQEYGSPPHGRGTRGAGHADGSGSRLTPAWAGNTRVGRHRLRTTKGSPPHGRGTRLDGGPDAFPAGLTPAWAGNTATSTTEP